MEIICFEDWKYYYFWKAHWVPSTFWNQKSFLDFFKDLWNCEFITKNPLNNTMFWKHLSKYKFISEKKEIKDIIDKLNIEFWEENEYWLLNRLDNNTWWLLYFAKSKEIFEEYKKLQWEFKIDKYYIANVYWNIRYSNKDWQLKIDYPIMHSRYFHDRMITVKIS